MKKVFYGLMVVMMMSTFTGCATIFGGSKYWAKVQVPDHPDAKIEYNGVYRGTGEANFKVKRKKANRFSVTLKEKGCKDQTTKFTQRTFRGWSLVGSIVGGTVTIIYGGAVFLPLPLGVALDGITGAWWKPDVNEKGVLKEDYNHYLYQIDYSDCKKPE